MAEKTKAGPIIAGLVLVTGGLGGIVYAVTRAKAAPPVPPPEEAAAAVHIEVIGAESHSPVSVNEGEDYIVRLTITNQSIKAGEPWEANLEVVVQVATPWTALIPVTATMEAFGAGQTRTFDYPMSIPLGTGGESGQIVAGVNDPAGVELAGAFEPLSITEVAIIYGAAVTIGV